jgi:hypothetical protein
MMRLKSLVINALLTASSALFTIGVVEGGTRLADYVTPGPARSWDDFRLRKPPPYQGAPYSVEVLISESKRIKWKTSPEFGWLPEDQSGSYINIENHERNTVPRIGHPLRRLWVFGGSTIMGVEVPDAFTIPSFLQRGLAETEVRNLGATTISVKHQLYRLETMAPVAPGDVVVFYDGVNDTILSLYYRNPYGTIIDANRKTIETLPWSERAVWFLYSKLKDHSAFARRFLDPTKPTDHQVTITEDMLKEFEEHYLSILKKADAFARSRSATFVHFLQPTIFTLAHQTDYERSLLSNGWLSPANLREAYAAGYPAIRRASQRAAAGGIATIDLSSALDSRQREVFLDFCHLTEHGNELVARSLLASIRPLVSESSGLRHPK